ncbi:histidine phosphatase family protein [Fictibacillus nanhaiensis]|uniref:histidine phosphatase family protein n=1 Tax=Fictibacillus nanhaiensis TaxID=742169 RepID=UPI001C94E593|nr:histidine phosphatase family protein [Fictibacillus nanhaiensis]MBY6036860.1 histidine phosphatase family protein [Fictibacillus nanhaiensis]
MKIGLVRHFKVTRGYPTQKWITPAEFDQWLKEYEASEVEDTEVDLGEMSWKKCYVSTVRRAEYTAEKIYDGELIKSDDLREIPVYPFFKRNIKIPMILYPLCIRAAWLINHKSQLERRTDVEKRISNILDRIIEEGEENALVVSHGGVMLFMRKELIRRGFKGPKLGRPENAKLYVFEKLNE